MYVLILLCVWTGEVYPNSTYNNVSRGHQIGISCSTEPAHHQIWIIMINDDAQTYRQFIYHACSSATYHDHSLGDLKCSATTTSNGMNVLTINMTVNHTTVLQCKSEACLSRAFAFFVHSDDVCTGKLMISISTTFITPHTRKLYTSWKSIFKEWGRWMYKNEEERDIHKKLPP